MSVRYQNPQIVLDAEARSLRVSFRLENRSADTWRCSDGYFVGWQLFDPATDLFIAEGDWQVLDQDLKPGESCQQELTIELPAGHGRYYVYISPLRESSGWFYRQGWPFLLMDASIEGGQAKLHGIKQTTIQALRWLKLLRSARYVFTSPARTVWGNSSLIRSMVRRDIAARYRGSFGDVLWTVLNPLLLMSTYFFVFGIVLRARYGGDPSLAGFALYFLAGMLPWLPFSEAVGRAPSIVLEHRNFVKKLVFPIETLPVNLAIAGLVTQVFALAVFMVFLLAARGTLPITALWLPVLLIPQLLFTLGISWFLGALGVYVRDLGQVIGFLLTLWFFLTPICYPEESLPAAAVPILEMNPIFILVSGFRDIFLESQPPAFGPLWKLWLLSAAVCILGHAWFYKLRKNFADVI